MIASLRLAALVAWLLLALLLHGLWRLVRARSPWPRRFLGVSAWLFGARVRVLGTPRRRDAVLLANHLSWLDILLLAGASGCAFVAKAELRAAPLVGWLSTLNRTVFVRRGDRLGVADQVAALRTALARGQPVAIFPEGTTGDGATLLPFKAALLAALDPPPPRLMVQPVRIDYEPAARALAWVGDEPGTAHARRVLTRRGTFVATLHFLEPFAPSGDRKAIAAEARRRILAAGSEATAFPIERAPCP
ncbi:lysophospholipid acyltransferase family protein [Sphingomonas sp. BK235]|uniref:lysophospholipid acyltransferase family protein n=1 Tax=Sphingomonas sp. BK235 TaxID=2512131 RepID=UPI00104EBC0B|nr:lysophospholipid acyltransferase family protein [Sphingomonas sp. BK235]TCP35963.1 lyso-ornithine lipid acyltransferase [Sphingomonas sp. BK235]